MGDFKELQSFLMNKQKSVRFHDISCLMKLLNSMYGQNFSNPQIAKVQGQIQHVKKNMRSTQLSTNNSQQPANLPSKYAVTPAIRYS